MSTIQKMALCMVAAFAFSCGESGSEQQGTAPAAGDAPATEMTETDAQQAAEKAEAAAAEMAEAAKVLLDETRQYIDDNKLELAEKSLAKLDEMKPKLPESYHDKIDSAHKLLEAAKAAGGIKMPGQ